MKGNKFLAAVLAASMAFSAVPVTAMNVFAESVAVDESDATLKNGANTITTTSYTVNGVSSTELAKDQTTDAYKIGAALNGVTINYTDATKDTDPAVINALQMPLNGLPGKTYTVKSTTLISGKGDGNVVVETSDGGTYTVVFTAKTQISGGEKDDLDTLFSKLTVVTYDGNKINSAVVKKALDGNKSSYTNLSSNTYTVDTATVADGVVTGTLHNNSNEYYTYKAKAVENTASQRDLIASAVEEVEQNSYPSYTTGTDATAVTNKIIADINEKLDGAASISSLGTPTYDAATHSRTGKLSAQIDGGLLAVFNLTHSSADKISESDKALATKAFKDSDTPLAADLSVFASSDTSATNNLNTNAATAANTYVFDSTSTFSRSIQSKDATKAVDADTVKEAVEKAVTAATADDVADGVTYKVESLDGKVDLDGGKDHLVTLPQKSGTGASATGVYVVKITASVANDLYGYTGASTTDDKTLESVKYVVVETPVLKSSAVTSIALNDMTYVMKKDSTDTVETTDKDDSTKVTTATTSGDVIEITPVLTPDDANSALTWTIKDAPDGIKNTLTTQARVDGTTNGIAETVTGADGKAVTIDSTNGKFFVSKPGTYTIEVSGNGKTASMKLTVKENYNDVAATAYYSDAVQWAYRNGTTTGISESLFGSNKDVTRAQFVTWLYRYAVSEDSSVAIDDDDVKSAFSDVATDKYYAKAVQWAVANGITDGTSDTTFNPDQKISRAQAITMLWRMEGKPSAGQGAQNEAVAKFTDVPTNTWYTTAVTWAVQNNPQVTSGTSTTTFSPNADCTRAQAITFIYRAYA